MQSGNLFEWLGGMLGAAIRAVVDGLSYIMTRLGHAFGDFTDGFTGAMGIHPSALNLLLLVVGLLFLVAGVRALFQRAIFGGVFCLFLAVLILGKLIAY